jgi:hypothetical protein
MAVGMAVHRGTDQALKTRSWESARDPQGKHDVGNQSNGFSALFRYGNHNSYMCKSPSPKGRVEIILSAFIATLGNSARAETQMG